MKKVIVATISIIVVVIAIITVNNLILKKRNNCIDESKSETDNGIIDFDLMNTDLENFDFNKYSVNECEIIIKGVINKHNNNEYSQYNNIDIQSKINRLKELIEVKKYYEELTKCLNHIKKNATFEEQKELYYKNDKDIVLTLCDINNDWSLLKISNNLYDTMKKNKGLLGSDNIKKFYIDNNPPYKVQRTKLIYESEKQKVELIISKETDYVYADENSYGSEIICNFIIEDTIILTDKQGNEVDTRRVFTKKNTRRNFEELCRDGNERGEMDYPDGEYYGYYGDDVAVSSNFRSRYPYFLDIFIHYSPLEYNKITLKDLDIDNQIATFEVDSILECKRRTYEVKYLLDDNQYLNDVELKIKNEQVLDNVKSDRMAQMFYRNSYLENINITDKLKKKYVEDGSLFPEISSIDYNFSFDRNKNMYDALRFEINNEKYQIRKFKINDDWVYYLWYYILDNNDYLDDVIYKKLPYDSSMTLEEVRDAFLADKELQKELGIEEN